MSKFLSQAQLLYMKQDEAARQVRVCSNSKFRPNTEYIRFLKKHRIPNSEYIRFLKNDRIRIPNSAIRTLLFE